MESLFNILSGWTNREIAMAIVMLILLAAFLIPMYLIHCTGRNLMHASCGLVANREWLLSNHIIHYRRYESRHPRKPVWRKWNRSKVICFGSVVIEIHTLSPSQRGIYQKAYSKLKRMEKRKA
ncbi:hypothetical protein [Providencia phage Kokobel2]|nr:hypothetical protein [Providencia phage Kokobel2]